MLGAREYSQTISIAYDTDIICEKYDKREGLTREIGLLDTEIDTLGEDVRGLQSWVEEL